MKAMQNFARSGNAALAALTLVLAGSAAGSAMFVPVAQAQTRPAETADQKLRRMDAEIKALQRKVFPDGAGKVFAPEITAGTPAATPPAGAPASSAVSDMLVRMDSLEAQLTRLTAQVEETQNRLSKLEALAAAAAAPAVAPTGEAAVAEGASAPAVALPKPTEAAPSSSSPAPASSAAATRPVQANAAPPKQAPTVDRVAAVQAIEKPQSGDRAEDEYSYGYRLWEAKFYPEAQQQLQRFIDQYPRHRRISYARNLLGRAYLDDNKPGTAAQAFVQNYQADPAGDRAPDSLLYLAVAMTRLKETKRACVALDELAEKYPAAVATRLSRDVARAKAGVKCN